MLAAGGVTFPTGVTAQASIVTLGDGATSIVTPGLHGQTGQSPATLGGAFVTPPHVGFAEAQFPIGPDLRATRIHSDVRSGQPRLRQRRLVHRLDW